MAPQSQSRTTGTTALLGVVAFLSLCSLLLGIALWQRLAAVEQGKAALWSWRTAATSEGAGDHAHHDDAGSAPGAKGGGTCSAKTCGAADPVSDPAYNMREIAKQCILLEEHLTVDRKYCVDCVAKHLLHCHGLAVEAVMLACDRLAQYPYMAQSPEFFRGLTERWLAHREDPELRRRIAAEVREYRKKVVQAYYIDAAGVSAAAVAAAAAETEDEHADHGAGYADSDSTPQRPTADLTTIQWGLM